MYFSYGVDGQSSSNESGPFQLLYLRSITSSDAGSASPVSMSTTLPRAIICRGESASTLLVASSARSAECQGLDALDRGDLRRHPLTFSLTQAGLFESGMVAA